MADEVPQNPKQAIVIWMWSLAVGDILSNIQSPLPFQHVV